MNLTVSPEEAGSGQGTRIRQAFTLPEVLITAAVSMLVMAGLITTHLFGLRLMEFTKPKLNASDNARVAVGRMIDELRSANIIRVGTMSGTNFTEISPGLTQQGDALEVFATTNMSAYSIYFRDSLDQKLKRTTNSATYVDVLASSISNQVVFTSEDYAGNILTDHLNNRVIGLTLQFYQIEYPIIKIGTGQYYDSYQVRTRVTRRKLF